MSFRACLPPVGRVLTALLVVLFNGCASLPDRPPGKLWGKLHHPRYGASAVTDGRFIYVLGGSDSTKRNLPTERLDTRTGEVELMPWSTLNRRYHAAVYQEGSIWLFGGESPAKFVPPVERIDVASGQVTTNGQLRLLRVGLKAEFHRNSLLLIGGLAQNDLQDGRGRTTERFNFSDASFSLGPTLPASIETSVASIGDQLHAVGGWKPDGGHTRSHYRLSDGLRWITLPDLPWQLSAHALVGAGTQLYSFGDYIEHGRVTRFDARDGQWQRIETAFTPRRHAAAVVVGESVYVIGGNIAPRRSALDVIEVFQLRDLKLARPLLSATPSR